MIEIKDLKKNFGDTAALRGITLEVRQGEILGFLGPNGAGKSTTMKILTGYWKPSGGEVRVAGLDAVEDSLAVRRKIGYLPETVPLYDDMRVYEYLRFIAEVRGLGPVEAKRRLKEVSESCGLAKVLRRPIDELSKGYRQRVGLAQAIMHDPEILILDEPTTGLDPNQIVEIRDLIRKLGREKTVIFSTHILSEVSATCDRVVIIADGKIVGEGSPAELVARAGAVELIYVKVKGPSDQILAAVRNLPNVARAEEKDRETDVIHGFEIEPKPGVDLREELAGEMMKNGWSILEFQKKTASLEDVFRQLTR